MKQLPVACDARFAVRSYLDDPDWMFKTGLGGVLNAGCMLLAAMIQNIWFVPVTLAVSAIVTGYLVRTAKKRQDEPNGKLPEWNDFSELIFGGLTWVAIQFGLGVIAAIPITTALIMGTVGIANYTSNQAAVAVLIGTVLLTFLFVFLGMHFFTSYLMLNFAKEEKLLAGFNIGKVMRYLIREPKTLLTAWVIAFQLQVFSIIVPAVTILGIFIVPSTFFAAQLVGVSLMAQAWSGIAEGEKYERAEITKTES